MRKICWPPLAFLILVTVSDATSNNPKTRLKTNSIPLDNTETDNVEIVGEGAAAEGTAENQLLSWSKDLELEMEKKGGNGVPRITVTNQRGRSLPSLTASLKINPSGPILLSDTNFIDHMAHFDRERIPERVVHAKGVGAHGYFELTHNITMYTKAAPFNRLGKRTPVFVRFSTVGGELGSADTAHDPRGFAIKFYTEQGIWNLVGNNLPVFPIRDPILFPSMVRSRKRNPQTHLKSPNMFWDFASLRPESTFHTLMLFSDFGFPLTLRHMNGAGVHTFKLVNGESQVTFCKFHWLSEQGVKNMTPGDATLLAGSNPDHFTQDLFNAISRSDFPAWRLYIQVMTPQEATLYPWNPFDITKVWLEKDFPLIPVGRLVLDRNPRDYFSEVEMAAFDPGDLIPGIEMSQDPMLHGRSFSYGDSQRYRLGPNFLQLPINRPKNFYFNVINPFQFLSSVTFQRDGMSVLENGNGGPNYWPNSFSRPASLVNNFPDPMAVESNYTVSGIVDRVDDGGDDNFSQAKIYLDSLTPEERERLVNNLIDNLRPVMPAIQQKTIENFQQVDAQFAQSIANGLSYY